MNHLATVLSLSFNSDRLFESISSVLDQTYENIEYIIIDDGSYSFDEHKVFEYVNLRKKQNIVSFKLLKNSRNHGTVYSINKAIKMSNGEYIFNLAGDDVFYDENVISDWIKAFVETNAMIMTGRRAVYSSDLRKEYDKLPTPTQIEMIKTLTPQQLFEKIAGENFIFECCTARSRACVEKYGSFNEDYRLIEDHPMNLKLLRNGERIVFFDRLIVKHRIGGTSCPIKINDSYEADADRIFEKEVLPYTCSKRTARRNYAVWKKKIKKEKKYKQRINRYLHNPTMLFLVKSCHYIAHPVNTVRSLVRRMRGKK